MVARGTQPQEVTVRNVGGVREATFVLQPGVNVLRGRNGSGKTSVMNAVARAYGARVPLEPRDGSGHGSVEVPGAKIAVKRVVKKTGEAELSLADPGPLAQLIDPQIDDPEKASAARLRALLEMTPLPVTEEHIRALAGDDEVADSVVQEFREGAVRDLLGAAERCRLTGHALKRDAEARADRMQGAVGAAQQRVTDSLERLGGEEAIIPLSAAEAEQAGHDAVRALEVARQSAAQRAQLEQQQEAARAAIGEVPDPAKFDADIDARQGALEAHEQRIADLTAKIAKERELMAGVRADLEALGRARAAEMNRLEQHREAARVLALPVSGSTPEEVDALELAVEQAKATFRAARLSDDVRAAREAAEAAEAEHRACQARAEDLRIAATTISERVGELLAELGLEGFTVSPEGRLAVLDEEGEAHDFATRRSEGQRIAAALRLAAVAYPHQVVTLDSRYWTALDAEHRAEFARIAAEKDLYILTEEPAEGELRVENEQVAA